MAVINPTFDFDGSGLVLNFYNTTQGATTFNWNFGFEGGTSTDENPSGIIFPVDGVYKITYGATTPDGSGITNLSLVITADSRINLTIREMVKYDAPSEINIDTIQYSQSIRSWQERIQPVLVPPFAVLPEDTFNEAKWPSLANQLIAKLVIYDIILAKARKLAMTAIGGKGALKAIETGPSKAEWTDPNALLQAIMKDGGLLNSITAEVCMAARAVGLILPMCPQNMPTVFIIGRKPRWPLYVSGIDRERGMGGFSLCNE